MIARAPYPRVPPAGAASAAIAPGSVGYHHPMGEPLVLLLIILVVVFMWRGPKNLPEIGRMLGRGVKSARTEIKSMRKDDDDTADPTAQ